MDLSTYNFPKTEPLDLVFSTTEAPQELVEEAKKRNPEKGIKLFNDIFYKGGVEIILKDEVKEGHWKHNAYLFAMSLMSSWQPKHQHKQIVCAMIFEECVKI